MVESLRSVLLLCVLYTVGGGANDLPLRVLYIGSSSLQAVDQAGWDVNNSSSILPGYSIQIINGESTVGLRIYLV